MIVKELDPPRGGDSLSRAGRRAEEQMAFYLRRAFADDPQARVFNDLRLGRGGEVCQIDHLILHRWGIVIVESKSVTSRVEINERGEWARLWDGRMRGMPSPVLQARRQGDLLRRLLADHAGDLLGKLLGLIQKQFGNMPIDVLAAVSDEGIIRQPRKSVEEAVCKADQVPDRLRAMIARYRSEANIFNPKGKGAYELSVQDVERVSAFLLARHEPCASEVPGSVGQAPVASAILSAPPPMPPAPAGQAASAPGPACRTCRSAGVSVEYGRYGYYLKCRDCGGNTPIKLTCKGCGGKARVRKSGPSFFADCEGCGRSELFHVSAVDSMRSAA